MDLGDLSPKNPRIVSRESSCTNSPLQRSDWSRGLSSVLVAQHITEGSQATPSIKFAHRIPRPQRGSTLPRRSTLLVLPVLPCYQEAIVSLRRFSSTGPMGEKSMKPRSTVLGVLLLTAFCLSHGETAAQDKEFLFGGMVSATESRLTDLDGYRYSFTVPQFRDNRVTATGGESEFNAGLTLGGWVFWNGSRNLGLKFGITYFQQAASSANRAPKESWTSPSGTARSCNTISSIPSRLPTSACPCSRAFNSRRIT